MIQDVCDRSKIEEATNTFGELDYMRLYDSLGDIEKAGFERLYDKFNQNRQYALETMHLNCETTVSNNGEKSLQIENCSNLVWMWNLAAQEYFTNLLRHGFKSSNYLFAEDKQLRKGLLNYKSVLQKLNPSVLANILSQEMFHFVVKMHNKVDDRSYYVSQLSLKLGRKVEEAFSKVIMMDYYKKNKSTVQKRSKSMLTSGYTAKYWLHSDVTKWSAFDIATVGSSMLAVALKLFHVNTPSRLNSSERELKPAFWHTMKTKKMHIIGVVMVNDALLKLISKREVDMASTSVIPQSLPLLVKPRPWTAVNEGGYLYGSHHPLLKTERNANEQAAYLRHAIINHKVDGFLDSLDDVSSCAWGVNQRILKVVDEIWSTGEAYLDIPGRVKEEVVYTPHKRISYKEKRTLVEKRMRIANKQTERNNLANALEVARMLAKHGDKFYYSYQMDFRGRLYPVTSSMFTHLGQDSIRSLLQFWYSKPLGKEGLRWLKIHLANMYGVDKIPNCAREKFVNLHIEDVADSAENPLTGKRWWANGDNPFQVLAVCMEINDAIKMDNPEYYLSRIAVNQDGSCNGLQHYAALGGDTNGAAQVNMIANMERPSDVYSEVANIVREKIDKDATNDNEIAKDLQGKISRKLVKQPVMTSVYGVTKFGMVRQLDDKLIDMKDLDKRKTPQYGPYIAGLISEAISELFSGANEIKQWLGDCTLRICESVRADIYLKSKISDEEFMRKYLTAMIWTTPLGLPVVQPYRKSQQMVVRTSQLQSLNLYNPFSLWFVDKPRQRQGIAPNYIHSLDSTHMLMTARECARSGLTFAAVHDSFWTHASTVSQMNTILRQQFISLHKYDLIERLRNEFISRYDGYMQLVYIPISCKSYSEIQTLRASYVGGKEISNLRHELNLELKRSNDKTITTPSSILEKNGELGSYTRVGGQGGIFTFLSDPITSSKTSIRVFIPIQIPAVPAKGVYDVSNVINNEYFFS